MDKNVAMIQFLMKCPTIQNNPLFFNFASEEDGNNHFITEKDERKKSFVDGSVLKHYTFSIASYSSVAHNAIVDGETITDQNLENMAKIQEILDWIDDEANKSKDPTDADYDTAPNPHLPDFGPDCVVDDMFTLSADPDIDGIDTSVNPPIARYSVGVKVSYLDNSKRFWN